MSQTNPPADPTNTDPTAATAPPAPAAPGAAAENLTLTANAGAAVAPRATEEGGGSSSGG
jgi:hypothetical protein